MNEHTAPALYALEHEGTVDVFSTLEGLVAHVRDTPVPGGAVCHVEGCLTTALHVLQMQPNAHAGSVSPGADPGCGLSAAAGSDPATRPGV